MFGNDITMHVLFCNNILLEIGLVFSNILLEINFQQYVVRDEFHKQNTIYSYTSILCKKLLLHAKIFSEVNS